MLTIFSIPKPFRDDINIIQRNAISSWLSFYPKCEIILFGDEEGIDKVAKEFNIRYIPEIKKNEFGTPLVNDVFEKAKKIANENILAYVNADIILMSDFMKAIENIKESRFLMVGRRWDLDIEELIDFQETDWEKGLVYRMNRKGKLHGLAGIDYFVFPKNLWREIPSFALGRTCWDNWFLYKASSMNVPIIDASRVIMAIHQNHTYSHHQKGKVGVWKGLEAKTNLKLAGGYSHLFTIRDADLILTSSGLKKPKLTTYRIISTPFRYFEKLPLLKPVLFLGWLGMVLWRKLKSI